MTSDPPRLSLERGPDDPLGQALRAALSDVPSAQQVAQMEQSLRRTIQPEYGAGLASRRGAFRGLRSARFAAAALAVTIAAGAATAFRLRAHTPAPPEVPTVTTPQPPPSQPAPDKPRRAARVEPALSAEAPQDPATAPEITPSPPVRRALDLPGKSSEPPPQTAPSSAELPPVEDEKNAAPERDRSSESALLGRAQRALGSTPALALALTQSHEKDYPHGVLTQERELIAVQALVALGRKSEASARADAFRRNFPGSAHIRRLDLLVAP